MADLVRQRIRPNGMGMTAPIGVEDALVRRLLEELQERVTSLSIASAPSAPESATIDTATPAITRLATLYATLARLQQGDAAKITGLEIALQRVGLWRCVNCSGADIPYRSMAELAGTSDDGLSLLISKPSIDNSITSVVVPYPIPILGIGLCLRNVLCDLDVLLGTGKTLVFGDRVGTVNGYWTAGKFSYGDWLIAGIISGGTGPADTTARAVFAPTGMPLLYKATANSAGGYVAAKRMNANKTVTGDAESFVDVS